MDSRGDYDVHLGFWTNWSYGKVRGGTITLTRDNGSLLIAFLAIFVGAAGKSLWRVLCFALHSLYSQPTTPQDGWYHQRQAILRNSETALNGAWQSLGSIIVWRRFNHGAGRILRRGIPVAILAIIVSCGFALAGVFSSRASNTDANEVLLSGERCGYPSLLNDSGRSATAYRVWQSRIRQEYLSQAQSCYQSVPAVDQCRLYVKRRLPLNIDRNAGCPFSKDICRAQSGNLRLDTGYMDTLSDFGFNSPLNDRVFFRSIYHCAPLKTKEFSVTSSVINSRNQSTELFRLYYGRTAPVFNWESYQNFTYQVLINVTTTSRLGRSFSALEPIKDYVLGTIAYYANTAAGYPQDWEPISQLQLPNTDLLLIFLSAPQILYSKMVDDPWFSAHKLLKDRRALINGGDGGAMYGKDESVSVIGCATQSQYCVPDSSKPGDKRCGPPVGHEEFSKKDKWNISLSNRELSKIESLQYIQETLDSLIQDIGSPLLVARSTLSKGLQAELPRNQWQIEMENIANIHLASMQGQMLQLINPPTSPELARIWVRASKNDTTIPGLWSLCNSQKIIDPRFPSFNVLGLSIILSVGTLLILLEYCLPSLVGYLHTRKQKSLHDEEKPATTAHSSTESFLNVATTSPATAHQAPDSKHAKHAEWNMTSVLQLQRLAHEGIGSGTWTRTSSETPITLPNEPLATLDFKKPPGSHPYLVKHGANVDSHVDMSTAQNRISSTSMSMRSDMDTQSITLGDAGEFQDVEISEVDSGVYDVLDDTSSCYSQPPIISVVVGPGLPEVAAPDVV